MTKSKHVLYFDNHFTAPIMVRGEGPYLYDEEGNRYLETCGGSISNSLAYGRQDMAAIIGGQALQLPFAYNAHMDRKPNGLCSDKENSGGYRRGKSAC